jgi:transposase
LDACYFHLLNFDDFYIDMPLILLLLLIIMYEIQFRNAVINYYNKFINISSNIVKDIKDIFRISTATLYNWIDLYKLNGNLIGKRPGRPLNSGKINEPIEKYIIKYYTIDKKSKIKNLLRSIKRIFNVKIKKSTVYNVLQKNNITYKKVSVHSSPFSGNEEKQKKLELGKNLNITE